MEARRSSVEHPGRPWMPAAGAMLFGKALKGTRFGQAESKGLPSRGPERAKVWW